MAPVEADVLNSNREPLFQITAAVVLVDLCLVTVLRYIGHAVRALPPAQKTRYREEQRKRTLTTFGSLAIASILVLVYHWAYALLGSYDAWADQQGEKTPGALWDGWYAGTDDQDWQLGKWWQDTNPPHDFKRAALGTSRALWWTQQLFVARLAFNTFVGIEGRRRDVPGWAVVALWGLSEFASLSLAQSLFFAILTLTQAPATRTQRGSRWAPHLLVYLVPIAAAAASIWLLPGLASNNVSWVAEYGFRLSAFLLATGTRFVPERFGQQYTDAHAAHHAESRVFSVISVVATAYFLRSTFWGALLNSGASYQRHFNPIWSTHPAYDRPLWSKLASASVKILGAISEDPIVGVIGWDVLFSGFGLCVWAASRGLDVRDMLNSILPSLRRQSIENKPSIKEETPTSPPESPGSSTARRRGRPKKTESSATQEPPSPVTRRSLRRRSATHDSDADGASYAPPPNVEAELADLEHEEERDDTVAEDAEASALAWGLSLIGGLGLMSAAVMGAEVTSG
ncbi:tetratricopeptide repeat protein 1 protein [Diplodia corticola]|uniref:Tetratricopeptide repeat protein 1 protein n=1 Tax=Diplodia corticola TaxID=236234 RepID=A0A1J9QQ69_9PEZI|nr:tetratricopeptide repeat protein 1 protein [Diplodia corticola]OJD30170.1 tetratricopeptide repeat protein 1 protein [Diplodia corticola]